MTTEPRISLRGMMGSMFVLVLIVSCTFKPRAKGVETEIVAVVSFEDRRLLSSLIDSVFGRVVYTPEPEHYFQVVYMDPSDFEKARYRPNVLVAALLSVPDSTADLLVKSILPESQLEMVQRGENHVFATRDLQARGQVFAVLAANTREELSLSLREKGQWLFDQFDSAFMERQAKHIFKQLEQKELSAQLEDKYGWHLRIQHDYVIIQDQPERNFVWLGRSFPYRWVSIHWTDNPDVKELDAQAVAEMVQNYPQVYYESVVFTHQYEQVVKTTFNDWPAWRVEGLWEHKKDVKGGPFISYLFYDESTDRLYHINFLIHHPSGRKIIPLRQMDIMVHTFTVIGE